jgi:hypothetical protein
MLKQHYQQNYEDHFGDGHCVACLKDCHNPRKLISRSEIDGINRALRERVRFEAGEFWQDALPENPESERGRSGYCVVCKKECSDPVNLITESEINDLDHTLSAMFTPLTDAEMSGCQMV